MWNFIGLAKRKRLGLISRRYRSHCNEYKLETLRRDAGSRSGFNTLDDGPQILVRVFVWNVARSDVDREIRAEMIEQRAFFGNVVGNVSTEDGGRQQGPAFGRVGVIVSAAAQQQRGNSRAQSIRQQPNASD